MLSLSRTERQLRYFLKVCILAALLNPEFDYKEKKMSYGEEIVTVNLITIEDSQLTHENYLLIGQKE